MCQYDAMIVFYLYISKSKKRNHLIAIQLVYSVTSKVM